MAKASFSPLGQWRGKAGGQVYRIRGGIQVVSNYQPSVSNPRTDAQLAQRARFNLMTGMNRITPIEVLRGYAGTPAQKRAAFSKDLAKYITAQYVAPSGDEAGKYVGTIDPHNIHFDKLIEDFFNSDLSGTSIGDYTGSFTGVDVEFKLSDMPEDENCILRCIDVFGPAGAPVSVRYDDQVVAAAPPQFAFEGVGRHRIFAQILVPTSKLNSVSGNVPFNEEQTDVPIVSDLTTGASANYAIGHCVYVGSHTVAAS